MHPMRRYLDMLVFGGERRVAQDAPPPPIWRRLFHIVAGSSIPLAGIFVSETAMIWALAILAGQGLALDLVRFRVGWLNALFTHWLAPLLKQDEAGHREYGRGTPGKSPHMATQGRPGLIRVARGPIGHVLWYHVILSAISHGRVIRAAPPHARSPL